MRSAPVLAPLALALVLAGCGDSIWWEYRDDPYLADMGKQGERAVLGHVNSPYAKERQMALRIIADAAGGARRRGGDVEADRLEEIILRRYHIERDQSVRAVVVRICAPLTGRGSTRIPAFLRDRIAAGEFPGYAALSIAALAPPGAFADIEPLTRHPAPEVRCQAAVALTILGDPNGFEGANRVWRGMNPRTWPDKVEGVPLREARDALALRIRRAFGRPAF